MPESGAALPDAVRKLGTPRSRPAFEPATPTPARGAREVLAHLRATSAERLAIANPKYATRA